ncbi:MAG: peptide ABC transporter substrate-binding protein [Erysipelotrichaceae bacterium]|nr:peptide ABC transporter substrate-binding protein [Erysipelotrichaceae bacterium]
MKFKRLAGFGLAAAATLGLASCGKGLPNEEYNEATGATADKDSEIFAEALGRFDSVYADSKTKTTDSYRYAAMAEAEAELLSSAVFLPTTTQGGNYALTKVAPRTAPYALWGTDEYRYKNLVVTNEKLKASDRKALLDKWTSSKGSAEYDPVSYAKEYLAGKDYTFAEEYVYQYTEGTATFDWLATSMASDSEVLVNLVDGLIEYNGENEIVPALASGWTKTKDDKGNATYTFTIRDDLYWAKATDGTKTEYKLTAQDFVTGFQHMLDAEGGLEYLVQGVVKGADEYLTGKTTDFAEVGVKADGNKVSYTLIGDPSYFLTYLSYNIYQPLNKEFFESQGGKLGRAAFATAAQSADYTYGVAPENVLTCGAYYIHNYEDASNFEFLANENYWDAGNIEISKITWLYNDGKDALKAYNWFKNDEISDVGLNSTALAQSKTDGLYDTYAYVSDTTATTYFAAYNLNRQTYSLPSGAVQSEQSKNEAIRTYAALQNRNFRLALSYAFDKAAWNAQSVGDDLKLNALRNSYTPYGFVSLTEDVNVKVGGVDKTYKAGTQYGQILQDYCDALGLKVDVKDGVNGWYQPEEAKKVMETALAELEADGVEISKGKKVVIDIFYYSASEVQTKQANSYKESVEAALGDYVEVSLIPAETTDDYYACGYRAADGASANYNVFYGSGWGPDYGDPSTYLDTFLSEGAGYMTKTIGLW